MKRKFFSMLLIVGMIASLFPMSAFAYESSHSAIDDYNQAVDVLVTADDTYSGSLSAFKSDLSAALVCKRSSCC